MSTKKFYRSRRERILGGVLGGLAEYLGVDPNLLRLAYIILLFLGDLSGALIGVYVLAWIFIPEEPVGSASIKEKEIDVRESSQEFSRIILFLIAAILILYGITLIVGELGRLLISSLFGFVEIFYRTLFGPWYVLIEGVKINLSNLIFAILIIVIGFFIIAHARRS